MTPIALSPDKVEDIVMACCSLHNYLRGQTSSRSLYTPQGSLDTEDPDTHVIHPGNWRSVGDPQGWQPLSRQGSNRHSSAARDVRDYLCNYFMSTEGEVPWQYDMI